MFNNNRLHLVLFAAFMCIQMVYGIRRKRTLVPQGADIAKIQAAQAAMHKPFAPSQITIPFDAPYGEALGDNAERCADILTCVTGSAVCSVLFLGCVFLPSEYNAATYPHAFLSSHWH